MGPNLQPVTYCHLDRMPIYTKTLFRQQRTAEWMGHSAGLTAFSYRYETLGLNSIIGNCMALDPHICITPFPFFNEEDPFPLIRRKEKEYLFFYQYPFYSFFQIS